MSARLELLVDLPPTEFQCRICLNVFKKAIIKEKVHVTQCKKNCAKSPQTPPPLSSQTEETEDDERENYGQPVHDVDMADYDSDDDWEDMEEETVNMDTLSKTLTETLTLDESVTEAETETQPRAKLYNFGKIKNVETKGEAAGKKLLALAIKHGVPQAFFDEAIKLFNQYIEGHLEPIPSYHLTKKLTESSYPIALKQHHVCRKGCMMFNIKKKTNCTYCGNPRYTEKKRCSDGSQQIDQPCATMGQLSLAKQLALLIHHKETREPLLYRSEREPSTNGYSDIFDGAVYKKLQKDGHFCNDLDIALALYTDGFTCFQKEQLTIIHFVILNLPPDVRYENKMMLQVGIVPGPDAPKSIFSFLSPLLQELRKLESSGIRVKADDKNIYTARAHLLLATGDLPATAKLLRHRTHTFKYGCRICEIIGAPVTQNGQKRGMYFAPGQGTPKTRALEDYKFGNKDKGLLKSPLASLETFHGSTFWGLDIMHLIGHGIARQFWKLICGKFGIKDNPFYLPPATRKLIGSSLVASNKTTASTFTACTTDISNQSGYMRAIDWIDFLRYFAPTTVAEHFTNIQTKAAILSLASICSISFKKSITDKDLKTLDKDVKIWIKFLRTHVDNKTIKGTVFTISQHYLTHLVPMIRAMGPPRYYSAFCMERAIGEIKQKVKSRSATGANAGNVMFSLAAQRHNTRIQGQPMITNDSILTDSQDGNAREIWGPHWNDTVDNYTDYNLKQLLKDYWKVHIKELKDISLNIEAGSRLWISEQEVIGSSFRHRNERRRDDFFTRMTIDVDLKKTKEIDNKPMVYFGDVVFYFRHKQQGRTRLLALVNMHEVTVPKGKGYPYLQAKAASRFLVVSAYDIESIAGRVDAQSGRTYIVWPEMGPLKPQEVGKLAHLYRSYKK